ncbi:MAG: hypothetical protein C0412_15565 [Flavobacterium sp.]|nr:hypothetical protein [Flavobacterium sp.]
MNQIKSITLCSSASFFKEGLKIRDKLKKLGFKVVVQHTARVMEKTRNYRISSYRTWFKNPELFSRKAKLMMKHFRAVEKGDAILVVNLKKKGMNGYIGGNVLMEMGLAFYLKKPIFLLNPLAKKSPLYEEVMGLRPVILNGDLSKLSF